MTLLLLDAGAGSGIDPVWGNAIYDSNKNSDFAADIASGGAGSTLVNGWTDLVGSIWSVSGGKLTGHPAGSPFGDALLRPSAENHADCRILTDFNSGDVQTLYLRHDRNAAGSCYMAIADPFGNFSIWKVTAGSAVQLSGAAGPPDFTTGYTLDFSAVGTTISLVLKNAATSAVVSTTSVVDATFASGSYAVGIFSNTYVSSMSSRVRTFVHQ